MNKRLWGATAAYAILAAIAFWVLEGRVLLMVLVVFAALALKTFIATKRDI
jgi:hypothetical protein